MQANLKKLYLSLKPYLYYSFLTYLFIACILNFADTFSRFRNNSNYAFLEFTVITSFSIIFLLAIYIIFILSKIIDNQNVVGNSLLELFNAAKKAPLTHGTIVVKNEDGSIRQESFNNFEEMKKKIYDITTKGSVNKTKELKDMTIEELNAEMKEAVEKQKYEKAATIRNLINEKTENKK